MPKKDDKYRIKAREIAQRHYRKEYPQYDLDVADWVVKAIEEALKYDNKQHSTES